MNIFKDLLNEDYQLMHGFSVYLHKDLKLAPETTNNYLRDLVRCFEWLAMFAPVGIKQGMCQMAGIENVAKNACVWQSAQQRKDRSRTISLDEKVRLRTLPAGGLKELHTAVVVAIAHSSLPPGALSEVQFREFMELLYSAIYVDSPNGRPGGVESLKLDQGLEMAEFTFAMSDAFKTRSKYGYQPVTVGQTSRPLLLTYLERVRPQVSLSNNAGREPLWLTFHGQPEMGVGRRVSSFFMRTLKLTITITSIRALVETEMQQKVLEQKATPVMCDAVKNINGHSSATVQAHYILQQRRADVYNSRAAFAVLLAPDQQTDDVADNTAVVDDDTFFDNLGAAFAEDLGDRLPTVSASTPPPPHPHPPALHAASTKRELTFEQRMQQLRKPQAPANWGTEHPDQHTASKRARWTEAEKNYVGDWITEFELRHPEASNKHAHCLRHIQHDPAALPIFHQYHVQTSARLRNGHRMYLKENESL